MCGSCAHSTEACGSMAETCHATIVAKTVARNAGGKSGFCIAAFDHSRQRLVRLVAAHGDATPFWVTLEVTGLEVGMRVLYRRCESSIASSLDRYPHKTDDVPCVRVWCCTTCDTADQTSLFDLLAPVARSSLDSFWPAYVRASGNAVKLDSKVPSLIAVAGTLTQISDMIQRTGHAELQLDDGSTVRGFYRSCAAISFVG